MISLEDYLRDMPPQKQVEALKSYLLHAEQERDALREQVARLEEERDMWRSHYNHTSNLLSAAVRKRCDLQSMSARLRAALDRYGWHEPGCEVASEGRGECECGYREAMEALKGAE